MKCNFNLKFQIKISFLKFHFFFFLLLLYIKFIASVILKFCLERLNDLHSLQYLLDGILYILKNFDVNAEDIKEVPKT